jgi:hypothetical protein
MYAASTAGSLAGAFLTGFVLVAHFELGRSSSAWGSH